MPHEMTMRVYYEDTDAAGFVYYGNYLKFFERARTEYLFELGVDIYELHRSGVFFVVVAVEVDYRKPGKLGDLVTIRTDVLETKKVSMRFRQTALRGDEVLVDARVRVACIDESGRPRPFPEKLIEMWSRKTE